MSGYSSQIPCKPCNPGTNSRVKHCVKFMFSVAGSNKCNSAGKCSNESKKIPPGWVAINNHCIGHYYDTVTICKHVVSYILTSYHHTAC